MMILSIIGKTTSERRAARMKRDSTCYTSSLGMPCQQLAYHIINRRQYSKLRLKIGNKVAEMGGNAVLGYQTFFDFENNGNIVARAIGTACTLKRVCTLQKRGS